MQLLAGLLILSLMESWAKVIGRLLHKKGREGSLIACAQRLEAQRRMLELGIGRLSKRLAALRRSNDEARRQGQLERCRMLEEEEKILERILASMKRGEAALTQLILRIETLAQVKEAFRPLGRICRLLDGLSPELRSVTGSLERSMEEVKNSLMSTISELRAREVEPLANWREEEEETEAILEEARRLVKTSEDDKVATEADLQLLLREAEEDYEGWGLGTFEPSSPPSALKGLESIGVMGED